MPNPIILADYDDTWPANFEAERALLQVAIGEWAVAIEHVGSTSVPGLAAKPIVDMMLGLRSLDDAPHIIEPLQRLGYEYVPEFEAQLPGRRYFRKGQPRSHQLHVVEVSSTFWRRHLAFRDYLRAHTGARDDYAALKRELAAKHTHNRNKYTDAKTDFIQNIERLAMEAAK